MRTIYLAAFAFVASTFGAHAVTMNLAQGQMESDDVQFFVEQSGVAVGADAVTVDYLVGDNLSVGDGFTGVNQFSAGLSLAEGVYDSFLIHFDPLNSNGGAASAEFEFDGEIVAVIVSNGAGKGNSNNGTAQLLNLSDAFFGVASSFETTLSRRSENHDTFELLDATTLSTNFATSSGFIDNVRVITQVAAVPLPASMLFLLTGAAGLAWFARRRA